jgi:hypothetical protein
VVDDAAFPATIAGLVNGTTYEVDTGRGTLVDRTPAAAGVTFTEIASGSSNTDLGEGATQDFTVNLSGVPAGGTLYLAYSVRSGIGDPTTWTLGGVSMPSFTVGGDTTSTPGQSDRFNSVGLARVARSSVGSGASTTLRMTASQGHGAVCWKLFRVVGAAADTDVFNAPINTATLTLDLTTVAGGAGIVVLSGNGPPNPAFTAGATLLGAVVAETTGDTTYLAVGTFTGASAGTRTITGTAGGSRTAGLSFSFAAA